MLVLSRKFGEEITIGTDIVIQVVEIRGDKVRLGITAPRDVEIMRKELIAGRINAAIALPTSALAPGDEVGSAGLAIELTTARDTGAGALPSQNVGLNTPT